MDTLLHQLPAALAMGLIGAVVFAAIGLALSATAAHASADGGPAAAADGAPSLDASFDRNLLPGAGQNTSDLSRFERGNVLLPGVYRTDIFLNQAWVGRNDVRFASPSPPFPSSLRWPTPPSRISC